MTLSIYGMGAGAGHCVKDISQTHTHKQKQSIHPSIYTKSAVDLNHKNHVDDGEKWCVES